MVLIVWILASSYFIYTLSQNTMYNEAMRARNQEEADRRSENVVAVSGNYSVSGDQVTVKVVLENAGSVAVQIINLWVFDNTTQRYSNTIPSQDINLKPGDVLYLTDSDGINVTIQGASSADNFVAWFVTGRGNVVPVEIAPPPEPEPEHLPISVTGFFSLDWFYLKYTARYNPTTPSDAAIISKSRDYVALYINVTNNGDEAMKIKSTSLIMLLVEMQEPLFYIVQDLSYPSGSTPFITQYYDDAIIIGPHQSQELKFAAKSPAQPTTWRWQIDFPFPGGSPTEGAVVMTALVYTMGQSTQIYAQSLSFRALVLTP